MNKNFDRLITISKKLIQLPDARHKHFSFIVKRNKILSVGYNLSFTTHPLSHKYGYRFSNIHSEMKAILDFPYPPTYLRDCTLINIRIMADGSVGLSKPCSKCQKLLKDFSITNIYYSVNGSRFEKYK